MFLINRVEDIIDKENAINDQDEKEKGLVQVANDVAARLG